MPDDLQRLERELRSLVADGVRRGLSSAEIRQQVSRLIATSKAPQVLRDQMLRDAERQAQFLSDTRMPPPDRDTLARITARTSSSFAQMQGAIDGRVARIIEDGLRRERSAQDMENRIAQVMGGVQYRAATVTSTALSAYNRTATMHGATQLGIERFRYAGPRGEREFCRAHVGMIFTADEIAQMDNGQGLPVKTYCGGYNCRHHWEPIVEKPADMPRQQPLQFGPDDARDPLTQAHFGGDSHVEADYGTRGFESMVLGQSMTHQQRSRLAGAPTGSHVVVQPAVSDDGMDGIHMSVSHPMYVMPSQRVVFRAADGSVELHNDLLVIRPDAPPGFGARVFATQVTQARALGVDRISVFAAGEFRSEWRGYYTWPRFGYDADIPDDVATQLPPSLWYAKRVSDLMTTVEGRQWWLINGHSLSMTFDLHDGSLSMIILTNYLKQEGIKL